MVLLIFVEFLSKLKYTVKTNIGVLIRITTILFFLLYYLHFRINSLNNSSIDYTLLLTIFLLGLAQYLKPAKLLTNSLILISMLIYSIFIFSWSINYSYKKDLILKANK